MQKGNLLIADDEELILEGLEFALEDYTDQIFTAEDGEEALKLLSEHEIHCVICDINMPKMNGVEVIKNIRNAGNNVPFIFYTAHGNHDLMLEAVKYGAFDFLNKPNLDGLEEVVTRGLNEGLNRKPEKTQDPESYLSEYRKLLEEVEKENK